MFVGHRRDRERVAWAATQPDLEEELKNDMLMGALGPASQSANLESLRAALVAMGFRPVEPPSSLKLPPIKTRT